MGSLMLGSYITPNEVHFPKTSRYAWNGVKNENKFLADRNANSYTDNSHKPFRNLFFFRNRPHAQQVRHIRGLVNEPVCTVGFNAKTLGKMRSSSNMGALERDVVNRCPQPKFKLDMSAKMWKAVPEMGLVSLQPRW